MQAYALKSSWNCCLNAAYAEHTTHACHSSETLTHTEDRVSDSEKPPSSCHQHMASHMTFLNRRCLTVAL